MKWILILGTPVSIILAIYLPSLIVLGPIVLIWIIYLTKSKSSSDTLINKGQLEEKPIPVAMGSPKQDRSLSSSAVIKRFATKVRGVSHKNPDGTDRQKIIKKCKKGEEVHLVREPDNPHNIANIAVFRKSGEQIGNISKDVAFRHPAFEDLTYDMDNDAQVSAKIIGITGGGRKYYGCNIEISVGTIPWEEKEKEAKELINEAKSLENINPAKSIELYVKTIKALRKVDQLYQNTLFYKRTGVELGCISPNAVFRKTRFPINRLSLLLEKNKKYKGCLNLIEKYEQFEDTLGLNKGDTESIRKRKDRMIKKLSQLE